MNISLLLMFALLPAAAFGADSYTVTVDPQKVTPVLKMLEADRFAQKIIEYGSAASVSVLGIGWFGMMFKATQIAYRDLREAGNVIAKFVGGTVLGASTKIASETVSSAAEKVRTLPSRISSRISSLGGKTKREISPLKLRAPSDSFFKSGGVGVGRKVRTDDIVSGKAGSSEIKKLHVGDREFFRDKEGNWMEKVRDGEVRSVSKEELGSLLGSSYDPRTGEGVSGIKVEYTDGTQAILNKQGNLWNEKLSADILADREKLRYRLSKDEVALNLNKLSPEQAAEIVNSLPAGTKISLTGGMFRNEKGSFDYHKVAFVKSESGLKLFKEYGSGKRQDIQEKFRELNEDKTFLKTGMIEGDFFEKLFKSNENKID